MYKKSISYAAVILFLLVMVVAALPANAAVYTYDALHRLTSVTYKNGQRIIYSYDRGGNITNVKYVIVDIIPPTVSAAKPTDGAINVSVSSAVYITLNEDVVEGEYFKDISLRNTIDNSLVDCITSVTGDTLTIDPAGELSYSMTYSACIPAGAVKDIAGNPLANDYSLSFNTRAAPNYLPPTIISTVPVHGDKLVPADSTITVVFSEAVQPGEYINEVTIKRGETIVGYTYEIYDKTLTLKPEGPLEYGETYQVKIPVGMVKDLDDTPLEKKYIFVFHTANPY
jgi:YD repeat-containing protein